MSKIDPRTEAVLKKYCDDPKKAIWNCHGTWIAYHAALEEIARKAMIRFDPPMVLEADGSNKVAAICVTGHMGEATEWSIGESAPGNNKNAYPFAMAEKRAKDRVILKLIGLHGAVYSEEEADDFKSSQPAPGAQPALANSGGDKVHIWSVKADTKPLWLQGALKLIEAANEFGELAEIQTANEKALNRLAETDPEAFARIETAIQHRHAQLFQAAE